MHISQLHLYTYAPTQLISGTLEVSHDGVKVQVELSESDRHRIQDICVGAFLAERQKIVDTVLNNSPAFTALAPPQDIEEGEFTAVEISNRHDDEEIPF